MPDGLELMRGRPNVAVLRTFSKAYALAGLRVGYVIAEDPVVAGALRKTHVPFSVSIPAQAAAVAALRFKTEVLWAQLDAIERGDTQPQSEMA